MDNFNYLLNNSFRVIIDQQKNVAICLNCKKIFANSNSLHLLEHRNYCNINKRRLLVKDATQPKRLRKTSIHDEMTTITTSDFERSTIEHYTISHQDENPISSPDTQQHCQQQQQPDPFESYQTAISPVDIDYDSEDELDVIQNLMPRSKEFLQLQDELSSTLAEYYHNKAIYYSKLTENSRIKRSLMLLESRKLQLEIEKLTNES